MRTYEKQPIAPQIMSWLSDIWATRGAGRSETAVLCYCWNWATSPSRLMDDREHGACGRLARYCKERLARVSDWVETDSGRLIPR